MQYPVIYTHKYFTLFVVMLSYLSNKKKVIFVSSKIEQSCLHNFASVCPTFCSMFVQFQLGHGALVNIIFFFLGFSGVCVGICAVKDAGCCRLHLRVWPLCHHCMGTGHGASFERQVLGGEHFARVAGFRLKEATEEYRECLSFSSCKGLYIHLH